MIRYDDFFLIIQGNEGNYTIEARGPGEISVPPLHLDFSFTDDLKNEIEMIAQGFAPTRERMQDSGSALYDALFPNKIARLFGRAFGELPEDTYLRLKLIVRPPELNRLPWELIFNPEDEFFMTTRQTYPLVRYVESATPVASLLTPQTLRVLYIQAQPKDTAVLNLEASEKALRDGLGADAEIVSVNNCTPELLRSHLREPFHILHYDGHAFFDPEQQLGAICLEDDEGNTHHVAGDMLATYLDGSSIRLVVLAACESGMDSPTKRFSGIAQQLMKSSNLPAVVAMQFAVVDSSAIAFNKAFYAALADRRPVEGAVAEGRQAILETISGDPFAAPDWATPVLFMRTKEGNVLPPIDRTIMGQQAGVGLTALSELVQVSPEIMQAAGAFRSTFESALIEVDVLGDYKKLHDLLHQIQFFCYEPITTEVESFPQERVLDLYDNYEGNLRLFLKSLKNIEEDGRVEKSDTGWLEDLAQSQVNLRQAVDQEDAAVLKTAIFSLKRIIATQPVRINKGLIDSAKKLDLPRLLNALKKISDQLQSLNLDESKTKDFQEGLTALTRLTTTLDSMLKDHDAWQALDSEIRIVDVLQDVDQGALVASWTSLKRHVSPLYLNIAAEWATNLQDRCDRLEEALKSNNPKTIRRAFKGFWRETNQRFYEVDVELKDLCDSLRQIGEPLNAILRRFE